jgi:dipeptidyl aminopeptidase/acylaminoacyl peptidase
MAGLTRINREELRPNHLSLINDGAGYAFLTQTGSRPDTLVIKPDDSHPSAEIQWQDQVRYFTAGKAALYVVSSLNDQPPGIWRYDLASGSTVCVVANVEKPFRYALNSRMTTETLTNGTGEQLTCYLLSPAHLMGKVKHPLVIGILGNQEMGFSWSANHEAIANCGAYFVNVDRHERDASKWADDAFAAYEALAKRPEIDTNQAVVIGRVHALEGGGTKSGWQAANRGVGQDLDASV